MSDTEWDSCKREILDFIKDQKLRNDKSDTQMLLLLQEVAVIKTKVLGWQIIFGYVWSPFCVIATGLIVYVLTHGIN